MEKNNKLCVRIPDAKIIVMGDNFWYERVYGPGEDIPLINIGPGPHPDPRVIGPKKDESLTGLLKKLKE